jgi:intracellular septation protein A
MLATRWLWVLIPTSAFLVSAGLLSYYWFTGNWGNWTLWMLTGPVVVGTIIVTIILYIANRKLARQVAYYTGMVLMVLTGTAIFAGTMFLLTQPEAVHNLPFAAEIDQAVQQGLNHGLKNIPNLPVLKRLLTPTP